MGGYGTWALITAYPDMFAAAVPICGGGDETKAKLVTTPVWAFHGELDRAVSVERSRTMVAAVRRAGGRAQLTEYEGDDHVIWNRAFAEPKLLPWVFAQKRRPSGRR
jgi:predicted peptidase